MNWGSASVDPERQILLVNSNRFASVIELLPRAIANKLGARPAPVPGPLAAQQGTAYGARVFGFLSPLFMPCQQPPYGFLTAIDLRTRRVIWNRPFGTARDSGPLGSSLGLSIPLGPPNMGGSITTRGGVTFIAASQENALHAFDTRTGRELWKGRLPAGGQATPMTYVAGAKRTQFVVIAAGGFLAWTRQGDYLVAFSLGE
jgi:glucose dehydrogenase